MSSARITQLLIDESNQRDVHRFKRFLGCVSIVILVGVYFGCIYLAIRITRPQESAGSNAVSNM